MRYFANFPTIKYKFGDENYPALMDNLTVYVDAIDQFKDEVSFYEWYTILDQDRPDVLSQKLYGNPDYHWTFFLLNETLREKGWPLSFQDLKQRYELGYPNRTCVTEDLIANNFLPGQTVEGLTSGTTGVILARRLDLGQLIIKSQDNFGDTEILSTTNGEGTEFRIQLISESIQYNSVHHYEDSNGDIVDINPYDQQTTGLVPITFADRLIQDNENLKKIKIIKPQLIQKVAREFKVLLRG